MIVCYANVATTILTLCAGLLSVVGVSGVGRLVLRPLQPLAMHWYAALAMLSGMALSALAVECLAMAGAGRAAFEMLGAAIFIVGIAGHWIGRGRWSGLPLPRARRLTCAVACLVVVPLVLISLAPSTKIDELFYHMLVGRRVLEDHGLRVYQLPAEQAIVPQMGYQIAQTIFHATNTVDAGNVLSLGFGVTLWLMIYGIVTDATDLPELGLLAAAASATGVYPAVWYVAAGPHAFGDLATFTATAALVFPAGLPESPRNRTLACVVGTVCAASAKLSLLPLAIVMTAAALHRLRGPARLGMGAATIGLWLLVEGPLVAWAYIHTGSPFGAAFAQWLGREPVATLALAYAHTLNQTGWRGALVYAVQSLNGCALALIVYGAAVACLQWKRFAPLPLLAAMQLIVIALFLPHDFRFLGGLQYALLVAGTLGLAPLLRARQSFTWAAAASFLLIAPWFAAELYYARPFAAVTLGATSRSTFLDRYVAFTADFRALDTILPRDATLYIGNVRAPSEDAPRPVIYALEDWNGRGALYALLLEPWNQQALMHLTCGNVVYRNPEAIALTYRSPNREPRRAPLVVRRCSADSTIR